MSAGAFASVNTETRWTFETTEKWKAVYGKISGMTNLNPGDSVGVFDTNGDCFGAGFFDGDFYYLSAFERDMGDKAGEDDAVVYDYEIPGFNHGDEVIFKVYVEAESREYTLKTLDAQSYIYVANVDVQDMYPPKRVDLMYTAPDAPLPPPEDGTPPAEDEDDGITRIVGALPVAVTEDKELDEEAPGVPTVAPTKEADSEEKLPAAARKEELPRDYYRKPPAARKKPAPSKIKLVTEQPERAPYSGKPAEARKTRPEFEEPEIPEMRHSPFLPKILLALFLMLLLFLSIRKLLKKE